MTVYATWPYGTKKSGIADLVNGALVMVKADDGQMHCMIGCDHAERPVPGQRYLMAFSAGGTTGGYWRIISRTDHITVPTPQPAAFALSGSPQPCRGKVRFADKKSAVSEARHRTGETGARRRGNRQRHGRPEFLRTYHCPDCNGWHLTHRKQNE